MAAFGLLPILMSSELVTFLERVCCHRHRNALISKSIRFFKQVSCESKIEKKNF